MIPRLALVALLGLVAAEDMLVHRGAGFTIEYPKKHSKLQPASAAVPFQLVYRKNSLLRLETERLTQPIDLSDETFAEIFRDVQLERLRERVDVPLESERIRRFSWGPAVEFHYYLPARSGKKNRRDLVTEIVTTLGETLFRFTYWIPEKDLKRVAAPFARIVESFEPEGRVAATEADARTPTASGRGSLVRSEADARETRREIAEASDPVARADLYAHLAEALGWKAYLAEEAEPSEIEEMRQAAEAAILATPGAVDAHQARAWAAYHESRMVEMEKEIQAALAIDPDNAESHLLYALWYAFNPERSEDMARQALDEDPGYAAAYYVKAVADRASGDLVEARSALEQAVKLDPGFVRARLALADVLRESGDTQAAIDATRGAVSAAPEDTNSRFKLALMLRRSGRIDEAIAEYQKILGLDASIAEVHYNLAVLLLQEKKRPELAREHFQRFVELDPDNARASQVRQWLAKNPAR